MLGKVRVVWLASSLAAWAAPLPGAAPTAAAVAGSSPSARGMMIAQAGAKALRGRRVVDGGSE